MQNSIWKKFIIQTISLGLVILCLKGIESSIFGFILASFVLGLLNSIIKPTLIIFTLPINLITLGSFTFVINGTLLMLTAWLVRGFNVNNLFFGIVGAILISIISFFINEFIDRREI